MAGEFKVDQVEAALMAALAEGGLPDVQGLSGEDLDEDGNLIAPLPATRVLFNGLTDNVDDNTKRLKSKVRQEFLVLCGAQNLRGRDDERKDACALVSQARSLLAGRQLPLEDATQTEPIALAGVDRWQTGPDGTWYAVKVTIADIAMFPAK